MGKEKGREVREGKGCTGHRKRIGEGKKRKEEANPARKRKDRRRSSPVPKRKRKKKGRKGKKIA